MLAVGALLLGTGCGGAEEAAEAPERPPEERKLSQVELVRKATPSVVRIFGRTGGGSGVVVDAARGYVLTNSHVAVGLTGMKAVVGDEPATETAARLVAAAPCEDTAIVRLVSKPPNLRAIEMGSSGSVTEGQQVTVLGYPGSLEEDERTGEAGQATALNTTTGTVSSANVAAAADPSLPRFPATIQHQAPVNPGNSGGPLVDERAKLIGINTLRNPETQGQFYAISIDRIKTLLPDLNRGVSQAYVGWDLVPLDDIDLAEVFANDPDFGSNGGEALGRAVRGILSENNRRALRSQQRDGVPGAPREDLLRRSHHCAGRPAGH